SESISIEGTANHPIVVKAQNSGKVIFTGESSVAIFMIRAKHIIIKGFQFKGLMLSKSNGSNGILINLNNSSQCRITECIFADNVVKEQFMPLIMISGNGENNLVDSCNFVNNINSQDLQVKITKETCPLNTLIQHNVFRDKPKVSWKGVNGGECVQVGQDPVMLGNSLSYTIVRENRFINCNGEAEVISNKSSGNSYIKNYFENCDGELVMRGGHDCLIDSNIFKGGKGIRISGSGHKVYNNIIVDAKTGIRLIYGAAKGKLETGFYIAASNCIIKENKIENAETGILIGDSKNVDLTGKFDPARYPSPLIQNVAPFDNQIEKNYFINCIHKVVTN
ncbi:MAG: hypothetical protein JWQ25_640, partial [Daejeonella sp.]|nr:hypothetical protein [Daejeonella sp.]